jgi:transglutaminase-like putative cysteine protease
MYRINVGCQLSYAAPLATPAVFIVKPPPHPRVTIAREEFEVVGAGAKGEYIDGFGNRCQRVTLAQGRSAVRYEALAVVTADADAVRADARQVPPEELSSALLRYTLPSRYAETDKLLPFAWQTFGAVPAGWERARAVCDWVRANIAYTPGVSLPQWSAADTIARREGVCRDRAHAVIALCRALNMPARYAVCYLPDIDVPDDGATMDFHAYAEVFLEDAWYVFDPHDAHPRKGRVPIATGLDAADAAFATLYGGAHLVRLEVWAEVVAAPAAQVRAPATEPAPDPAVVLAAAV